MIAHCLFEQSGTFKKEFLKLGYKAIDYDIENRFNETDIEVDIFEEIEKAYRNEKSIFDKMKEEDIILAFFPCTRFENQIGLAFRGENYSFRNWNNIKKLKYDLILHKSLNEFYEKITKLAIIIYERNLKMIIENPYSEQHYLKRYWCIKPTIIDYDRRENGDYFKKPTQYWFINCQPKYNYIFEPIIKKENKTIAQEKYGIERSLISEEYANRFIRENIIEENDI